MQKDFWSGVSEEHRFKNEIKKGLRKEHSNLTRTKVSTRKMRVPSRVMQDFYVLNEYVFRIWIETWIDSSKD